MKYKINVWYCCKCTQGPLNPSIDVACYDCHHSRCRRCKVEASRGETFLDKSRIEQNGETGTRATNQITLLESQEQKGNGEETVATQSPVGSEEFSGSFVSSTSVACFWAKLDPDRHAECVAQQYHVVDSLWQNHLQVHRDKEHINAHTLQLVQKLEPSINTSKIQGREQLPETCWRRSFITLFPVFSQVEQDLDVYHGVSLFQDPKILVELRKEQYSYFNDISRTQPKSGEASRQSLQTVGMATPKDPGSMTSEHGAVLTSSTPVYSSSNLSIHPEVPSRVDDAEPHKWGVKTQTNGSKEKSVDGNADNSIQASPKESPVLSQGAVKYSRLIVEAKSKTPQPALASKGLEPDESGEVLERLTPPFGDASQNEAFQIPDESSPYRLGLRKHVPAHSKNVPSTTSAVGVIDQPLAMAACANAPVSGDNYAIDVGSVQTSHSSAHPGNQTVELDEDDASAQPEGSLQSISEDTLSVMLLRWEQEDLSDGPWTTASHTGRWPDQLASNLNDLLARLNELPRKLPPRGLSQNRRNQWMVLTRRRELRQQPLCKGRSAEGMRFKDSSATSPNLLKGQVNHIVKRV